MTSTRPLRVDELSEGLPVAANPSEALPEALFLGGPRSASAWLGAGHPGRIKHWRYGLDHVLVEWYGFEDAVVSDILGWCTASEDDPTYHALTPISEEEYQRRCADVDHQHP
jgi:hypothetical protein